MPSEPRAMIPWSPPPRRLLSTLKKSSLSTERHTSVTSRYGDGSGSTR